MQGKAVVILKSGEARLIDNVVATPSTQDRFLVIYANPLTHLFPADSVVQAFSGNDEEVERWADKLGINLKSLSPQYAGTRS